MVEPREPREGEHGLGWAGMASRRRLDLNWVNWARPYQRQPGHRLSLGHVQSSFCSFYPPTHEMDSP